jgi:hypothetical protein
VIKRPGSTVNDRPEKGDALQRARDVRPSRLSDVGGADKRSTPGLEDHVAMARENARVSPCEGRVGADEAHPTIDGSRRVIGNLNNWQNFKRRTGYSSACANVAMMWKARRSTYI